MKLILQILLFLTTMVLSKTGCYDEDDKVIGKTGDMVTVYADTNAKDNVMGQDVFEVIHDKTKDVLLVTVEDIEEA